MKIILILLLILLGLSLSFNFLIIREVKAISDQLVFIVENRTLMQVSTDLNLACLVRLSQTINKFLLDFHQKEKLFRINKESIQKTITGLSHDIRTPLTSLDGYLQLLSFSQDGEEMERYLRIMKNRILSLNKILDQLFTYVKVQEEAYKLDMEVVDVRKVCLETLLNFYQDFKFKLIEPNISIEEKEMKIRSNRDGLERIFQNIYRNILVHGENPLQISLKDEGDKIVFISKNKIKEGSTIRSDQVFKEFYKASRSRNESSTGLGLAIAKGLAEKLEARIEARVEDGFFSIIIYFDKDR
ncbi:MAG: HAMP domain-containing sensor histidine kinase [Anaerococcus sp.]|nr:HAMP domain-containing sensor histidine kinase [Anaerococcus sp.]